MVNKILLLIIFSAVLLLNSSTVLADDVGPGKICRQGIDVCTKDVKGNIYDCLPSGFKDINDKDVYQCQLSTVGNTFGKIQAPDPLKGFLAKNPTGAGAISQFLSNGIILIYSIAAIALIFMILWGAFEWLTSAGDKEAIAKARNRIINAVIGIILFAVAFAIIRVLGQFTGFTFFKGT